MDRFLILCLGVAWFGFSCTGRAPVTSARPDVRGLNVVAGQMTVKAYFINQDQDPQRLDCSRVDAVSRTVPKTVAAARAALEKLLAGPTATEKQAGFMTVINPGVTVASLSIQDGVAHVTFSRELQEGVGGSCLVTTIRSQIEQTLLQFPSVTSVRISVEGYADDEVLQP